MPHLARAEFRFGTGIIDAFDAIHEYTRITQLDEKLNALDGVRNGPIARAHGGFGFVIGHCRLKDELEYVSAHIISTAGD